MATTLVTNKDVKNDAYIVKTFAQFIQDATGDEGIKFDGDFFLIDVAALPDEEIYESIVDAEMGNKWVLLEGEVPDWFHSEIEETPKELDSSKLNDSETSVLAEALSFLNENPDPSQQADEEDERQGSIITFGSAKGGAGKQVQVGTPILAEHGWVPVEKIKVGDKVWTPKGTLTEVTGFFPQGKNPLYRFTTTAGQWLNCGLDHQWTVTKFDKTKWQTMTTRELLDKGLVNGSGRSHYYKWAIPVAKAIPFAEKELPLNPYLLGVMIGDGCCTDIPLSISSNDEFVIAKVAKILGAKGYKQKNKSYAWHFYTGNKILNGLNECFQTKDVLAGVPEIACKAGEKRIPHIYKVSSIAQRWELIQGLFDTDGSCMNRKGRKAALRYDTTSRQLAYDIREVLYSLGIEARIRVQDRRGKKHAGAAEKYEYKSIEYGVVVCCPVELYSQFFSLPVKLEKAKKAISEYNPQSDVRRYDRVNIKSIEYVGENDAYCISVADEDKLYITKDYIVTHNTFTTLITARYYAKDHPEQKVCLLDLDIREPQIGAVFRAKGKSIKPYYTNYTMGNTDFKYLEKCKYSHKGMPKNLDFYLSVKEQHPIDDKDFWETLMTKLFFNYDMVFLDTGTEYLDVPAIITAYKVADRINLVCMPNIATSIIVDRQIKYLTGEYENAIYTKEDGIADKLNLVFTNYYDNSITDGILETLGDKCPVAARFGNLTPQIDTVEVLNQWDHFDDNEDFVQGVKRLYGEI